MTPLYDTNKHGSSTTMTPLYDTNKHRSSTRPQPYLLSQLTPWLLDLGGLLLSLACVVAVNALLLHYQNKPPPTWVC